MIFFKMIAAKLKKDNDLLYEIQSNQSIEWLEKNGISPNSHPNVLDLSCGFGFFGGLMAKRGYNVTFADVANYLSEKFKSEKLIEIDLNIQPLSILGKYDLVIFSNALEHIAFPEKIIPQFPNILNSNGILYLSWTNWLSPYGGHEYSPFHYFGYKFANLMYKVICKKDHGASHIPHKLGTDLFKTYIGKTLKQINSLKALQIIKQNPRFFRFAPFLTKIPILREFLCWNMELLIKKVDEE